MKWHPYQSTRGRWWFKLTETDDPESKTLCRSTTHYPTEEKARERMVEFIDQIAMFSTQVAKAQAAENMARDNVAEVTETLASTKKELGHARNARAQLRNRVDALKADLTSQIEKVAELGGELEHVTGQRQAAREALVQAQEELIQAREALDGARSERDEQKTIAQRRCRDLDSERAQMDKVRKLSGERLAQLNNANESLRNAEAEKVNLASELRACRDDRDEALETARDRLREIDRLTAELAQAKRPALGRFFDRFKQQ